MRLIEKSILAVSVGTFFFWTETVPRELTKLYDELAKIYYEYKDSVSNGD